MSLLPAYDKNNRFIAVVDPRTKALWMTTLILMSFLSDSILEMVVILLLIPVSSVIMRQKLATYKNVLPILLIIASQLVFLQILFCRQGEIIHSWWILDIYSQALPLAAVGILRTSTIVLAVMQFLSFTSALDLQLLLMKCGLPYKYATLAALGIRFMPLIEDEFEAIKDSQSARGLSMNSMVDKLRNLPSMAMPLLYRSMRWSQNTALAMELRGFGKHREHTFTKELRLRYWDTIPSIAMTVSIFFTIIY